MTLTPKVFVFGSVRVHVFFAVKLGVGGVHGAVAVFVPILTPLIEQVIVAWLHNGTLETNVPVPVDETQPAPFVVLQTDGTGFAAIMSGEGVIAGPGEPVPEGGHSPGKV